MGASTSGSRRWLTAGALLLAGLVAWAPAFLAAGLTPERSAARQFFSIPLAVLPAAAGGGFAVTFAPVSGWKKGFLFGLASNLAGAIGAIGVLAITIAMEVQGLPSNFTSLAVLIVVLLPFTLVLAGSSGAWVAARRDRLRHLVAPPPPVVGLPGGPPAPSRTAEKMFGPWESFFFGLPRASGRRGFDRGAPARVLLTMVAWMTPPFVALLAWALARPKEVRGSDSGPFLLANLALPVAVAFMASRTGLPRRLLGLIPGLLCPLLLLLFWSLPLYWVSTQNELQRIEGSPAEDALIFAVQNSALLLFLTIPAAVVAGLVGAGRFRPISPTAPDDGPPSFEAFVPPSVAKRK